MTEWEKYRSERLALSDKKRTVEQEANYTLKNDIAIAEKVIAKILKPLGNGKGLRCPLCESEESGVIINKAKMRSANFYCEGCGEHGPIFIWTAWKNEHPTPLRTDYEEVYFHAWKFLPYLAPYMEEYRDSYLAGK